MPPSDPAAFPQAVELFERLAAQSGNGVLFGHQDTSAYGVNWKQEDDKSDIKDAVSKWPAVYGWDLGGVEEGKEANLDGVPFAHIAKCIREADLRGGINTVSFHQKNPMTEGGAFDNTPAVDMIVPGGDHHLDYLTVLDAIAMFLATLKRDDGTTIPLIVRPYHEPNRPWPWWSLETCEEEQYITLYQMTVDHLRNTHELHNLLYCFSPQDVSDADEYMKGYPGDDHVDVLGLDFYEVCDEIQAARMGEALSMLNQLAAEHGKLAALTETGVQNIPRDDWFTTHLQLALQTDEHSQRTVWALLWRNANEEHFFAPYPGHASVPDFQALLDSGAVVMGADAATQDTQEPEQPEKPDDGGCVIM